MNKKYKAILCKILTKKLDFLIKMKYNIYQIKIWKERCIYGN